METLFIDPRPEHDPLPYRNEQRLSLCPCNNCVKSAMVGSLHKASGSFSACYLADGAAKYQFICYK